MFGVIDAVVMVRFSRHFFPLKPPMGPPNVILIPSLFVLGVG